MPQVLQLGLTVPDPDLKWNEEKAQYEFGAINWDEFFAVLAGKGPCNYERIQARKKAWEGGAWVRESAAVYAQKQQQDHAEKVA